MDQKLKLHTHHVLKQKFYRQATENLPLKYGKINKRKIYRYVKHK